MEVKNDFIDRMKSITVELIDRINKIKTDLIVRMRAYSFYSISS